MENIFDRITITDNELLKYTDSVDTLSKKGKALLAQQKKTWEMLKTNYANLSLVQVKIFEFDGFTIKVQFNPGRIRSSAAKVDKKSIQERKCFLCPANLPEVQKGILVANDYLLLNNPFPIFDQHFTIPKTAHTNQQIKGNFEDMLDISRDFDDFVLFYNGPKCGASAPDHFHFQAGNKFFMPIDLEYADVVKSRGETLVNDSELRIMAVENYLRKFIAFESSNKELLVKRFYEFYEKIVPMWKDEDEPMMNILASYQDGAWRIIYFPRGAHRPSQYFAEGDENILLSPASVDFGGVCITPQQKDFKKITKEDITDIFRQVSVDDETFAKLMGFVKK